MTDDRPLIDHGQAALCLGHDIGHIMVAVNPDGTESYWLMVPVEDDPDRRVPIPRHEHEGPLPRGIADATRAHRCGQPRTDGHPCRAYVAHPGATCRHHRHAQWEATP